MKSFKLSFSILSLFIMILSFSSCQKEEDLTRTFSVRYEFEGSNYFDALIQWTDKDGGLNGSSVEDAEWEQIEPSLFTYSFSTNEELNLLFKAQNTTSASDVEIRLYIDNILVQSAEANSLLEAIISYQLEY